MSDCLDALERISNSITVLGLFAARPPRWPDTETRIVMTRTELVNAHRACSDLRALSQLCKTFNDILEALALQYPHHKDWIKQQRIESC